MMPMALPLTLSCLLISCTSLPQSWGSKKEFKVRDGHYFPKFISNYFIKSQSFQKNLPTISQARRGIRLIEVRPLVRDNESKNESNLSWSKNGRFLSYENITNRFRSIYVRELNGSFQQNLTVHKTRKTNFLDGLLDQDIHSYNSGLTWSQSEQQYAFMSNGGVGEFNIYVGGIDDKPEVAAKSSSKDGYAVWSPTGADLAFVSARSGQGDIYLIDVDDTYLQQVSTSKEADLFPEWLPDGKGIIYSSGPSNRHQITLSQRSPQGQWQKPQYITQWDCDNLRPKVSPSGKWVAFYGSTEKKTWNIYVMPLGAGVALSLDRSKHLVAEDVIVDLNTGPSWTPDGSKLFYVQRDPDRFNPIYSFDLRSGKSYQINTKTHMNRDLMISSLGVLSFRAQVGAWDKVFVALTNQGLQLQNQQPVSRIRTKHANYLYSNTNMQKRTPSL